MNPPFFMGIDGGGSRLRIAVTDASLTAAAKLTASAANPNIIGHDTAREHIRSSIGRALKQAHLVADSISAVGIGIAGASKLHSREWLISTVEARLPSSLLVPSSDLEIALVGALAQRHGVLLLAGTGSAVFGIAPTGRTRQIGGWGYLLGDEGGGYWSGLQVLRHIIRKSETSDADFGRANFDSFSHKVLGELGLAAPRELIPWLYQGQQSAVLRVAAIAQIALQQAQLGERDAISILQQAAIQLVSQLELVTRQLEYERAPIAFAGGLLDNSNVLSMDVTRRLKLKSRPIAQYPPVMGAALLAQIEWNSQGKI